MSTETREFGYMTNEYILLLMFTYFHWNSIYFYVELVSCKVVWLSNIRYASCNYFLVLLYGYSFSLSLQTWQIISFFMILWIVFYKKGYEIENIQFHLFIALEIFIGFSFFLLHIYKKWPVLYYPNNLFHKNKMQV